MLVRKRQAPPTPQNHRLLPRNESSEVQKKANGKRFGEARISGNTNVLKVISCLVGGILVGLVYHPNPAERASVATPLPVTRRTTPIQNRINNVHENSVDDKTPDHHRYTSAVASTGKVRPGDEDCIFKNSPIYRKVYVYPDYHDQHWNGDILSESGRTGASPVWPWIAWREASQKNATSHYDIDSQHVQYATELLVRELMIHPDSCLRTDNPDEATLFYVPYLPSVEHHRGDKNTANMSLSPFGNAIIDILDNGNYTSWERTWGLTSQYWKRRQGSDHILVYSEPLHGLWHPRSKRGNYHFVNSQKQLAPPIAISVELSTTFVEMYPACTRKNILVPYPNTDGRWFNGYHKSVAHRTWTNSKSRPSLAAIPHEREFFKQNPHVSLDETAVRPVSQFYAAGNHGTCTQLRRSLAADYRACSTSAKVLGEELGLQTKHTASMQLSTFCPCPGGDSPSAKRMYDAVLAGCIPVVLSHDFVWPFTSEFDAVQEEEVQNKQKENSAMTWLGNPNNFSIRLQTPDWNTAMLDPKTCQATNASKPSLQEYLDSVPASQLDALRNGVEKARQVYNWYQYRPDLPDNPLRENVLPDGGTAHAVVRALADRAEGVRWPACRDEGIAAREVKQPRKFKC